MKTVPIGLLRELLLVAAEGAVMLTDDEIDVEYPLTSADICFLHNLINFHPDVQVRRMMLNELNRGENGNV